MIKKGYVNDHICLHIFIKKSESRFIIVTIYVDDMNLIRVLEKLIKVVQYLKKEFKINDLGKTKYCFILQIEHNSNGTHINQSVYNEKLLEHFNMNKTYPLNTSMIVQSHDLKK